ncbi:hypothetical protein GN958_ATG07474 [Phytophthora infestans]|uniref:Uncharacterized protein n=1 Tax=Phytophthora infestans TaxID=4787 RepID=A0A8S9UVN6_PHYIN|nr:hypothetical protein GN958_ATG07474 [Phytophthora infestans]
MEEEALTVPDTDEKRYLGHYVGTRDMTGTSWRKAFEAIKVRLTLAEVKTNTAEPRAMIAAAIIVPKLIYIARHAWPTQELGTETDLRIRISCGAGASQLLEPLR